MESVVSPPGVAISSMRRSPTSRVNRFSTTMSAVALLCGGSFLPNRFWIAAIPPVSRSENANALRLAR